MNSILSLAVMLVAVSAAAETSTLQERQLTVESTTISDDLARPTHTLGILLDAGVPDGLGLSLAFRPAYWVRLELGMLENSVSPGIRGGLTLIPFNYWITPTVTLEAGH